MDGAQVSSIRKLIHLEPDHSPDDVAIFRVEKRDTELPPPLELDGTSLQSEMDVAAIGYPARDSRNHFFSMLRYFKNIFEVKRLSPGKLMSTQHEVWVEHDCTTLGGSQDPL